MSVQQELRDQLRDAMRNKDQRRLDAIRQVEAEVSTAKSAAGFDGEVDDALYLRVIGAYVKKMQKALKEYESAGDRGQELVDQLRFEVDFYARWLPKLMSEEDTRALVERTVADLGVSGPKAVGRVIGQIMKEHKGSVDGALVNRLVREALAS